MGTVAWRVSSDAVGQDTEYSTLLHLSPRILAWGLPMAKELKTAEQLSDMVVHALGIKEVYIHVRKDHAYSHGA